MSGRWSGLLGPNGAGKTTLISLLLGLRRPDSGTVELFGGDPRDPANRARLGSTPQETGLPATLRVGEVAVSLALPTRAGRDLLVWAVTEAPWPPLALPVLALWALLAGAVAVWAYRRDEGRRFR